MFSIILGMIFLALIIYVREKSSGYENDTCPRCKRKFTLKIIYPDPNNAEEVRGAKVMRKRCEACGYILNILCDFEKIGRIGQYLVKFDAVENLKRHQQTILNTITIGVARQN